MKAELWKKIGELFAVTMASFVQQPGTSLMEGASPGLHGLIETTSNFGVAGDKTG